MSYIGQTLPTDVFGGYATDTFAGDGSATTFTLSQAPFNEQGLIVVINNVIQQPTTNYTVSGTTLTIVGTAVASGDVIYARHTGVALPIGEANALDLQGQSDKLILDADADTTISADTDDQIDFKAGGTDIMSLTATTVTINDGTTITTADNTAQLTLTSTDADANAGPILIMNRNSASPADNDYIGNIQMEMENDADENLDAVSILGQVIDASDGTEDARLYTYVRTAGSMRDRFSIAPGETVFNEDSVDVNFRVESDGNANCFKVDAGLSTIGINGDATSADYPLTVGANSKTYSYIKLNNTVSGTGVSNGLDIGISSLNVLYYLIEDGDHIFYNGASPAERFRIANNGDLTGTDTSISSNSDQRLKKDIVDHTYDISKFKQFKPRSFAWRNPEAHTNEATTGFVAQEVESIDSDWASSIAWEENDKTPSLPKYAEEKTLCNNEDRKTSKLGKKDAMYISVIQQLITRIEALEDA
jgi:hypothetical protein